MAIVYYDVGDGKTYATVAAAKAAIIAATGGNVAGKGEQRIRIFPGGVHIGNMYRYDEGLDMQAGIVGEAAGVDFLSVYGMVSNEGRRNTGIVLNPPAAGAGTRIVVPGAHSVISGLGLTCAATTPNSAYAIYLAPVTDLLVENCVIFDVEGRAIYFIQNGTHHIRNVAVINTTGQSAVYLQRGTNHVHNLSVLNLSHPTKAARGIHLKDTTAHITNSVMAKCQDACIFRQSGLNPTVSHTTTDDATGNAWGGVGNQINKDADNDIEFPDTNAGTEDIHIEPTSCIVDTGTDLSGEGFDYDITGYTRPYGTDWDRGAWEYRPPADCKVVRLPDAYYGKYALLAPPSGEHCYQDVNVGTGDFVLSARARCYGWGVGEAVLTARFLDGIDGAQVGSALSVIGYPQGEWEPLRLPVSTPTGAVALRTELSRNSDADVLFDALQLSLSGELEQFAFVSPAATVEYETDPTGVYEYQTRPYDVDDVDLNPVYNAISRGFLTIGEYIDDPHMEPVGRGGHCILPDVTGHFVAYKGTGEVASLAGYPVIMVEPPTGLAPYDHFLDSYPVLAEQTTYAFLNVGRVTEDMYEYAGAFTAGAINYPSGVQDESWVIPGPTSGEYPIDLDVGSGAWLDVLKWRLQNIVLDNSGVLSGIHDFDGVMYEGMHYADQLLPQLGNQREDMAALVGALHEWASSQPGEADLLCGISNGLGVVRHAVFNAESVLDQLDAILIDGLSVRSDLSYATVLERNRTRAQVLHTLRDQAYRGSGEAEVYALDYITPNPASLTGEPGISMRAVDEDIIRLSTHFSAIERWYYSCGPDSLTGVYDPPIATGLYDYGIGEYIEPTGECVGRMHMPWAKHSGYNKLVQRGMFHPVNTGVNEDYTYPDDMPQPATMTIASVLPAYDELDVRPAHVHDIEDGVAWVDWHFYGIKIGENTTADGRVRVDLSVTVANPDASRVVVAVYSDLAGTTEVARGERNSVKSAGSVQAVPVPLTESNGSGLTGIALVDVPVWGALPFATTFYPQFPDPWRPHRADDRDDLFMCLHRCRKYSISAIVRDQFNNPVDHTLVYAATSVGSLDHEKKRTDRSGVVTFTLTLSALPTTGVATGLLQLVCPKGGLEQHVYIDVTGCTPC